MQASPKSLRVMLSSSSSFVIPRYQRPYVWTKEEVEELWDDLHGSFKEVQQKATETDQSSEGSENESRNAVPEPYFMGPIVVANDQKQAVIIDGQQRITTLQTLLWIMYAKFVTSSADNAKSQTNSLMRVITKPDETALLTVAARDEPNFQIIQGNGNALDETMALGTAARLLRQKVQSLTDEELIAFTNFVLDLTQFIYVEADDFEGAWELFVGLNSKGRPLNPADLIKARICGVGAQADRLAAIWDESVVPLGNDATSAMLGIYGVATGEYISEKQLFKKFAEKWDKGDKPIHPELVISGSKAYHDFWLDPRFGGNTLSVDALRAMRSIRAMQRRDATPLLLALASVYGYQTLFRTELLAALDLFHFRMGVSRLRGRERDFSQLAYKIRKEKPKLDDTLSQIADLIRRKVPDENAVRGAILSSVYPGRMMKHIIKSHEEGIGIGTHYDDVWYEHIMPQEGKEWFEMAGTRDPNEYSRIVNRIGNIVALDPKTNREGWYFAWAKKRILYLERAKKWEVHQIAIDNPDSWTPGKIELRSQAIADWCLQVRWPLDSTLQRING